MLMGECMPDDIACRNLCMQAAAVRMRDVDVGSSACMQAVIEAALHMHDAACPPG